MIKTLFYHDFYKITQYRNIFNIAYNNAYKPL